MQLICITVSEHRFTWRAFLKRKNIYKDTSFLLAGSVLKRGSLGALSQKGQQSTTPVKSVLFPPGIWIVKIGVQLSLDCTTAR